MLQAMTKNSALSLFARLSYVSLHVLKLVSLFSRGVVNLCILSTYTTFSRTNAWALLTPLSQHFKNFSEIFT